MTDLATRLRETYVAVLDPIEPADRFDELPPPAAARRPRRGIRPTFAFAAAALVTLVSVGAVALVGSSRAPRPETVVATTETFAGETATLLEVGFPDALVFAAGGAGGRPIVAATTGLGELVIRRSLSPTEWEQVPPVPWEDRARIVASASDGDTFALLVADGEGEFISTIRTTTDGSEWKTYVISASSRDWGNPVARRSHHIDDVSVNEGRVVVVVREEPALDYEELEQLLRSEGVTSFDHDETAVGSGPEGIDVDLPDGTRRVFKLAELGIDPEWGFPTTEIWRTNPDRSTTGIPFEENRPGAERATALTAAISGDRLYVGGSRRGDAFLAVTDIGTTTIQPFTEFDLSGFAFPDEARAERVTSLRAKDGLVIATVDSARTAALVQIRGDDRSDWAAVQTSGSLDELAVDDTRVFATGHPQARLVRLTLPEGPASSVSLAGEWGIGDRHPTGIVATAEGLIAVPQSGAGPSSFGKDGSLWLIRFVDEEPGNGQ